MSLKTKHKDFRNFVHLTLILLLLLIIILQTSLAAEIKGKIVGKNGENLNGAEVKIYNGTNLVEKTVAVNGRYAVNLSEGNYLVVVTYIDKKENLYIDSTNLTIKQDETKSMDFSLAAPYTNFSDDYIPALEDIFNIGTNLTGGLQSNKSNNTNLSNPGGNSSNMLLLIFIIFIPVIILVFFYILSVYYKARKAEEKIDKVEKIITSKNKETASSSTTIPSETTPPSAVNKQEAQISEKEEYKEKGDSKKEKEEVNKKEDIFQKERENLLSSLTKNERIVVDFLMKHDGDLLRTEISRGTNLPKSSLSVALKKLEDKKIIEIDKTFTIHRVKFTDWFRSLL